MAHALIFGASGISGWAVTKEALSYPTSTTFKQVTALTNRPLSVEDARLPQDPRLSLVSGVDLTASPESVVAALKDKATDIDTVSHVFFTVYIDPGTGYDDLRKVNVQILKTAIEAITQLSTKLVSVILQTGGKSYGVEFTDKVSLSVPLKETAPRIPEPYYNNIFYYFQADLLKSLSANASWTYTEIRPDVIIGFVPSTNVMNCAQGLGLYLSLYRQVYGAGAQVAFPGSPGGWTCKHSDTSQDILGKFQIYAALNPDKLGDGRIFNIADGATTTWQAKWPKICDYFELKGTGPGEHEPPDQFAKKHADVWRQTVEKHGLKQGRLEAYGWGVLDAVVTFFNFDRQYDLSAAEAAGFTETVDTVEGYKIAFDRMKAAKVIP